MLTPSYETVSPLEVPSVFNSRAAPSPVVKTLRNSDLISPKVLRQPDPAIIQRAHTGAASRIARGREIN